MGKLESIGAIVNLLGFFFDKRSINEAKTKAAIDAAEKYIMISEGDSPYDSLSSKKKKKYLRHYRKRFIAYN